MFCCFSILKNVVPRTNIKKLQRVQTSVARVVLPNFSYHPATALLSELHSLPVNSRITFKLACLTYKLLTTGRPAYLHKQIHHYTLTRTLRSTDQPVCLSVCLSVCHSNCEHRDELTLRLATVPVSQTTPAGRTDCTLDTCCNQQTHTRSAPTDKI